jgi:hypothetical protein
MTKILERVSPVVSVDMPGGVWTVKEFVVFDGATTEQLCQSVVRLTKLNLSSKWALGDLGIALQARKRIQVEKEAQALREKANAIDATEPEAKEHKKRLIKEAEDIEASRVDEYARELADVLKVDEGHWRNCVSLARFFPVSLRNDTLFPEHHIAAMKAAGGAKGEPAKAQAWLNDAAQQELTASELRKRVNLSLATAKPVKGPPHEDDYAAITQADTWAMRAKDSAQSLTPEQAHHVWSLTLALREWLAIVHERMEIGDVPGVANGR